MTRTARAFAGLLALAGCVAPTAPPVAPVTAPPPAPAPTPIATTPFRWTGNLVQGGLIVGTAPVGTRMLAADGKAIALAPDGTFLLGFDRDASSTTTLVATLADGRIVTQPLTIAPRGWSISRLSTLPKIPVPDAEFAARRPAELERIKAARAIASDAQGWRQRFAWPATGRISTLFGSQRIYRNGEAGAYHSGVDVAVPTGTPILAPADGVVVLAADDPFTLEGKLLMVDHGMGLGSAFLHLSRIDVRAGDRVRQGQPIALSGATGRATGPHLHWGMTWQGARLDPLLAAGGMPQR
ncbi:murein DD-endopeptidase MepM/ murein hydrolase activator NlpD [Sphingomonas jinjuensis]|uniref:Murein DD-endopeptidase MepM/ murein hydrolase activator NlpD n=1 Tax=Sphingomonas jinjuensis TaxID=535907 RepID=A0A840FF96_9SPHN|nr:M23 family metallopeptidase [Sphingomonas jinjuensis]MBB4152668.1 murein DD-endopeptidase MepM/ murein hydrolase activator NlpD [Sphingomonas jinjuensis]